ncbi:MAG: hypothetical protein KYX69_11810 [Sphingomonas sp.]|uniref:hypothetical protein n=1 Tax=Sphingomonas sp. TaxID=28214 RepID=UPI002602146B|nr:hypothetical protein [Sphingomonas sp.]MDK2768392.1 hypothetical protein [Sphingomonas sp.]
MTPNPQRDDKGIGSRIAAVLADLDATSDRTLGGSAAAARANARRVADHLLAMAAAGEALPRHAGKASPGKVAAAMAERSGASFNRQNFATNEWCARLLAEFADWEGKARGGALADAVEAAEAKRPAERRVGELEREVLLLRAENQQLRNELAAVRSLIARTGRTP